MPLYKDDAIEKASGVKQLAGTIKSFESENTRSGLKYCNHREKNKISYKLCGYTRVPGPSFRYSKIISPK